MICLGDIHINSKRDLKFERSRIYALAKESHNWQDEDVYLCGDTFDTNSPSPEDYRLFYHLTSEMVKSVRSVTIFAGNHDFHVIDSLWAPHLTIVKRPMLNDTVCIIPWTHIKEYQNFIPEGTDLSNRVLLTHARCTVPPFINEEVSIAELTKGFGLTIMGDIHMPYSPLPNVHYTSSPSQTDFSTYKKDSCGYIQVDGLEAYYKPLDLPRREKVLIQSIDEIPKEVDDRHLYKYVLKTTDRSIIKRKVKLLPNQRLELTYAIDQKDEEVDDQLKEFMRDKLTVRDILVEHLRKHPKLDPEAVGEIIKRSRL